MKGKFKRIFSAVLSMAVLTCTFPSANISTSAEQPVQHYDAMDIENIQDGVILHCFDWKYTDIIDELPNIAEAGFTAVQTSPAQPGGNNDPEAESGTWWWLYQPLSFSIGTNYLGTKAQLESLCTEAHKYGIKVIVDIVANHLASVHTYIQEDLKPSAYWHVYDSNRGENDKRYRTTYKDLGMPDIASENDYVQQCVKNYVKELKSVGVDGLRWDTLKHIQLPSEDCKFFTTVLDGNMYNYGESLGDPGGNSDAQNVALMQEYTELMSVTDDVYGRDLRNAFNSGTAPSTSGNWAYRGVTADTLVYWGESHDTWSNDKDYGYSNEMSQNVIDRAYAIAASRSGATSLYFSRPSETIKDNILAGVKGSTHFTSAEVAAVNHFHNAFIGKSEYYSYSGKVAYTERGVKGAVLVYAPGGSATISVPAKKMLDGTYLDHVSGSTFTVSNGTISGTIGSTGIAVIYNDGDVDEPIIESDKLHLVPNDTWKRANGRYAMYLWNGSGNTWVDMTDADGDGTYSADLPTGKWTNVIFCCMEGSTTENNWDNKFYQTIDLFPDSGTNRFTVKTMTSTKYTGTWDAFGEVIHTHSYTGPVWTWSADHTSAQAVFSCKCGDSVSYDADTYLSCNGGSVLYTATVTVDGTEYTDEVYAEEYELFGSREAYKTLTDSQKQLYRELFVFAKGIVDGRKTSSVFSISSGLKTTWTSSELGLGSSATLDDTCQAIDAMVAEIFPYNNQIDMEKTIDALLADCPYEFYWFAKTQSHSFGTPEYQCDVSGYNGAWTVTLSAVPTFKVSMPVSEHYQANTATSIDTSKINAVKNTVPAAAQTIVDRYANVSDYEKLKGYSYELCEAVEYNQAAANGNVDDYDLDPWQLVYVFDGDDNTNVVCEGYSKAFKYLCDLTDFNSELVKCYLVTGWLSQGSGSSEVHMWNVVTMDDGKNYLVDVTNSDITGRTYNSFILNGGNLNGDFYQIRSRDNNNDVLYFAYDNDTKNLWTSDILTLNSTNYDGSQVIPTYTVTWNNYDGSLIKTDTVASGTVPTYDGATPIRTATAQYTYTFSGWTPTVTAVTGNVTYTATYTSSVNSYTVTWKDYDNTTLETDENVPYGTIPTYDSETPSRTGYTFSGWTPTVTAVTGNVTYTANYSETPIVDQINLTEYNFANWEDVYIYWWIKNDEGNVTENNGDWPGQKISPIDDDNFVFTATVPSNVTGIIFNNGNTANIKKTEDITGISGDTIFAVSISTNGSTIRSRIISADYYLVGSMNGWTAKTEYKFEPNKNSIGGVEEYILFANLSQNDECKVKGDDNTWFPSGSGNNYIIANTAPYTIYFRPNGNGGDDWYCNYFKVEKMTQHTVTFTDGDTDIDSQTVTDGYTVTPPSEPQKENYTFAGWYIGDSPYDFGTPVTENITLTAHWYTNVIIRCRDINNIVTSQTVYKETFTAGDFAVPSNPYIDGYTFQKWTVNGTDCTTAEAVKAAVTPLVTAGVNVEVVTVYEKVISTHRVSVPNGSFVGDGTVTEKNFNVADLVTVTADKQSAEQSFERWERVKDGGNIIVSYNQTYSFFMPDEDVELTAVYTHEPAPKGVAFIEKVTPYTDTGKMSFIAVCNIPEDFTMVKGGLIADLSSDNVSSYDTARFKKMSTKATSNTKSLKYTWTVGGFNDETVIYVRAYLVYKNSNDEEITVLGDIIKASLSSWEKINEVT